MKRMSYFLYGTLVYVFFLATFLYLAGFVENLVVPKSVDSGAGVGGILAVLINLSLIALFGIQHAVMARLSFKKWWTTIIPKPIERSTFVLATNVVLCLMFWLWQPMPSLIWDAQNESLRLFLLGISAMGWTLVLMSTFLINHFDLFGLRQVYLYLVGKPYTHLPFKTVGVYKNVRHPLMLGFMIAFWVTPTMTAGHLLLASAFTAVILVGVVLEEKDLVTIHGKDYEDYIQSTSKFFPMPKKSGKKMSVILN